MFAVYLEGVLPVVMAAFFGGLLGVPIYRHDSNLSNSGSFVLGVKISIAAAVAWLVVGVLSIVVCGRFFDTTRFAGGIVVLAFFGFPVYGLISGFAGVALRRLAIRRGTMKGVSG